MRTIVVFVAAALVAAAAYLFFRPDETVATPSVAVPVPPALAEQPVALDSPESDAVRTSPAIVNGLARLDASARLSDMAKAASSSSPNRGQALAELYGAISYCDNLSVTASRLSIADKAAMKTPEGRRRIEARQAFHKRFCDGQSGTTDTVLDQLAELGPENPVVQSFGLLSMEEKEASTVGMAIAERLGDQAESPAALERASWFLMSRGEVLPAMKVVKAPASVQGAEGRADAQRLVVMMVACQVRGGCETGGFQTQLWCTNCEPGTSLEASWQRQYAPDTIKYAREVAAVIVDRKQKN